MIIRAHRAAEYHVCGSCSCSSNQKRTTPQAEHVALGADVLHERADLHARIGPYACPQCLPHDHLFTLTEARPMSSASAVHHSIYTTLSAYVFAGGTWQLLL